MEEFSQDLSVALEEANQQESDSCTEQVMQKPRRPRRRRVRKGDAKLVDVAGPSRSAGDPESDASQSDAAEAESTARDATAGGLSCSSQQQPSRANRVKRNPRMQVEVDERSLDIGANHVEDVEMTPLTQQPGGEDCPMESAFSSSSSDLPSECGGCCGCSSEADDEQTDFPHSEPPPPKMAALLVDHTATSRGAMGARAGSEHGRHHGGGGNLTGTHHLSSMSMGIGHHVTNHLSLTNEFRRRVHSAGNRTGGGCQEQAGGRKRRRRCCPLVTATTVAAPACSTGSSSMTDSLPGLKLVPSCVRDQPTV